MTTTKEFGNKFKNEVDDGVKKKKETREPADVWNDIKSSYPSAKINEDAFIDDENADLFIAVFKEESEDETYYCFYFISKVKGQKIKIKGCTVDAMVKPEWSKLKEGIDKKDVVISTGKLFYECLIGGLFFHIKADGFNALQNSDKIKFLRDKFENRGYSLTETAKFESGMLRDQEDYIVKEKGEELYIYTTGNVLKYVDMGLHRIWIYCEDEDIKGIWEWIHTRDGEPFFWGDKFSIIRIQKGCDMSECLVNKKIFVLANNEEDEDKFVNPLQSNLLDAGLNASNYEVIRSPRDITNLDCCIILYAAGNDNIIREKYEDILSMFFIQKNKILFFNLYPPGPLKLDELPVAWIDSQFDNITEDFTLTFVNYFFKAYKNLLEKDKRTKVRVTEIVAKTREMMESENILWRLGCVVNGNPNITLTA